MNKVEDLDRLEQVLANTAAEQDATINAKALKWVDARLEELIGADQAARLLAAKVIAEFFEHFYRYRDMGPTHYWEDLLGMTSDQVIEERVLRQAFIHQLKGALTEADFDRT